MLSESDRLELEALLRVAEIAVSPDDLPAMETQFLLVKRLRSVVDAAVAELDPTEPGFRFDARWPSEP